ncbi:MAG: DRTGG domain-containing protein [Thermotaleaceae bacterium]
MKIKEIKKLLDATCITEKQNMEEEVDTAFGCDLMSDVLAFSCGKTLLLTGLTNPQVIRTAEMLDIHVIIFVRGKKPSQEVIDLANENHMTLLCTNHIMYTACGILFKNGLKGVPVGGVELGND